MITQHVPLILASGSVIRAQMLKEVGLTFSVLPSSTDEEAIKQAQSKLFYPELAQELALAKALSVGKDHPGSLTIGADQLCVCDHIPGESKILDKPGSLAKAAEQLKYMRDVPHEQYAAVVVVKGEEVLFRYTGNAKMRIRALSDEEIAAYVRVDEPVDSCGGYKFESLGRHLFDEVKGDMDVIKGLPLVPLLKKLHELKAISFA